MNGKEAQIIKKYTKEQFDGEHSKGRCELGQGGLLVQELVVHPDGAQIAAEGIEPQMKVLGHGPFKGFGGHLPVESRFHRLLPTEDKMQSAECRNPSKEGEGGHLGLEEGGIGRSPVVHGRPKRGSEPIERFWIDDVRNGGESNRCSGGHLVRIGVGNGIVVIVGKRDI